MGYVLRLCSVCCICSKFKFKVRLSLGLVAQDAGCAMAKNDDAFMTDKICCVITSDANVTALHSLNFPDKMRSRITCFVPLDARGSISCLSVGSHAD